MDVHLDLIRHLDVLGSRTLSVRCRECTVTADQRRAGSGNEIVWMETFSETGPTIPARAKLGPIVARHGAF